MPSKESLERAANYNRHDWHGTTSDGIHRYCELCVKLADLLDEAIREERRETKIATMVSAIYVVATYSDSITSPFCKEKIAVADSMIEAARVIEKELRARLAQLREGKT